jgi:hypothetical protein
VDLENPKRGIYRASQSALEESYERHLKARAEGKKNQALNAKKLNIKKNILKSENLKRRDQKLKPLSSEERVTFFESEAGQTLLEKALSEAGLLQDK